MCMNCGCGEPETRHKPTDITSDDIKKASGDGQLDKTIQNMRDSLDKMGQSGSGQQGGYSAQSGSGQQGGTSGQSGSGQQGGTSGQSGSMGQSGSGQSGQQGGTSGQTGTGQ